jgi:hypothetical protein
VPCPINFHEASIKSLHSFLITHINPFSYRNARRFSVALLVSRVFPSHLFSQKIKYTHIVNIADK